jgi:hypothetical protein
VFPLPFPLPRYRVRQGQVQGSRTYLAVFPLPFPLPKYRFDQGQVCKVAEHICCVSTALSSSNTQNLSGAGLQGSRTYPAALPIPFPLPRYRIHQGQVCKVSEHIFKIRATWTDFYKIKSIFTRHITNFHFLLLHHTRLNCMLTIC